MKIRTDFVTNSSSSSFVTYNLTNSEFCKYLTEQMAKNDFSYAKSNTEIDGDAMDERPNSEVFLSETSLSASICCQYEGLNYDEFLSDYDGYDFDDFDDEDWKRIKIQYGFARDVKKMTKKFIKVINEFIPLEKVDDIDKLHKAFENDLKNGNFECEITIGCTD